MLNNFTNDKKLFRLGVRSCGNMWYNPRSGRYSRTDKYDGRKYNEAQFKESLREFLSDGERLRIPLVKSLLCQLVKLKSTLQRLDSYRFYSRSVVPCTVEVDVYCYRYLIHFITLAVRSWSFTTD